MIGRRSHLMSYNQATSSCIWQYSSVSQCIVAALLLQLQLQHSLRYTFNICKMRWYSIFFSFCKERKMQLFILIIITAMRGKICFSIYFGFMAYLPVLIFSESEQLCCAMLSIYFLRSGLISVSMLHCVIMIDTGNNKTSTFWNCKMCKEHSDLWLCFIYTLLSIKQNVICQLSPPAICWT